MWKYFCPSFLVIAALAAAIVVGFGGECDTKVTKKEDVHRPLPYTKNMQART